MGTRFDTGSSGNVASAAKRLRIYERYIHREHARLLLGVLWAFCLLFTIATFLDTVDDAIENHVPALYALEVALLKLPSAIKELAGVSVAASVLTLTLMLSKNLEPVILRSLGVDLRVLVKPLAIQGGILALVAFFNASFLAPSLLLRAQEVYHRTIKGERYVKKVTPVKMWVKHKGFICYIGFFNTKRRRARDVRCYSDKGVFVKAEEARWKGRWMGHNVKRWEIEGERTRISSYRVTELDMLPTPGELSGMGKGPQEMDTIELVKVILALNREGINSRTYQVELASRIFLPLLCVVLAVLAFPLGIVEPRKAQVTLSLAKGIALVVGSYTLYYGFAFMGTRGVLNPLLASFIPLALMGAAAVHTLRRGIC